MFVYPCKGDAENKSANVEQVSELHDIAVALNNREHHYERRENHWGEKENHISGHAGVH